jgi:hypothetical protein
MQDGIIKGTGNSRYLKSIEGFLDLYPTYEDFAKALVDGTLPIDLNGINEEAWQQLGTALNKANLLTDSTASQYGKGSSATVNDILSAARSLITTAQSAASTAQSTANGRMVGAVGSYTGAYSTTSNAGKTLTFSFTPKLVIVGAAFYTDSSSNQTGFLMRFNYSDTSNQCLYITQYGSMSMTSTVYSGGSFSGNTLTLPGDFNLSKYNYIYVAF